MPVPLNTFLEIMEEIAPRGLCEAWDNSGLLIEPEKTELARILVALDPLEQVAEEAVSVNADILLTHHPLFMGGVKHITRDDPATRAAWTLLRNGIGLFSAHTNLDEAPGGVNDVLAGLLGLRDVKRLGEGDPSAAPLRLGALGAPEPLASFIRRVNAALDVEAAYVGDPERLIKSAAVCGGGGMGMLKSAADSGADVYVTADVKHHQALDASALGIALVDATHYASERVILLPLINRLQDRFDALQYNVTLICSSVERSVFRRA